MTNKEKFMLLVSNEEVTTFERNRERVKNRAMLRESQQIALKVILRLDELGWSQKDLAERMGVSPPQITKIVKGQENFTLETQIKLQEILNIPILASYQEPKTVQSQSLFSIETEEDEKSRMTFTINHLLQEEARFVNPEMANTTGNVRKFTPRLMNLQSLEESDFTLFKEG